MGQLLCMMSMAQFYWYSSLIIFSLKLQLCMILLLLSHFHMMERPSFSLKTLQGWFSAECKNIHRLCSMGILEGYVNGQLGHLT
ncbi:unnamed protein product [Blepharisma stoltei]|uniref:Uncharacterized protein n=1 Tax=Blepharisma stoltei TaxID=1481888 RepID=A0AAU9JR42_9CILI|nr:unnamed protein product [Blepharisma stoltei]